MKKVFLMGLLLASMLSAWAYDYPYLSVQTADGQVVQVAVESLVLTVVDGRLVATNGDGEQAFAVGDLTKMFFAEKDPTGVVNIVSTVNVDNMIDVYSADGVFVGRFGSNEEAKGALRKGIYVMKQNGRTYKIAVR